MPRPACMRSVRAWISTLCALLLAHSAPAQEVRRAERANEPPVAPAVPFDFDATPAPKPRTSAPTISDETGERTAPPPIDGTTSAASQDQVQLDFANGFYARKLYDLAAPEYEKYLGLYANAPDRQVALFRLGESYRIAGNLAQAKNAYQTLVVSFTAGDFIGPAAYRLGDIYYAEKNFSAALTYFRKASVKVKDPAVALAAKFYTARCLEALKSPSEARLVYADLLDTKEGNPFREASRLSLAQILTASGRKEEALRQYDALQQESAKLEVKTEALVRSGLLRIELGQADKGAVDLNKALKSPQIGSWRPLAEIGLLRVLYETGKYKQLIDIYEKGAKDFPAETKPEVLLLAANSKRQIGDHSGAREIYEQVAKEYAGSDYAKEAAYERLVSLYNAGDPNLAKQVDDYLAGDPEPSKRDQVTLLKAESLFKQEKYNEAEPLYAAMERSALPANLKAEAMFKLGWCRMQNKTYNEAIAAFGEFLDGNPQHKLVPATLAQRAVAFQQTKDFKNALRDFNELISRYPKAKERELALQQKALILGQQQDNAGMAATFAELLHDYPGSAAAAQANYWIGWAAFEAKNYKAAIDPLEAARKLDREQFFERASLRIMHAHYYLENRDALAADVETYTQGAPKGKVPAEVLRWVGASFLNDKNYEQAEKYFARLTERDQDVSPDDWLNLGRAQLREKKWDETQKTLRKYLGEATQPLARASGLLVFGEAQLGSAQLDDAQKSADEACTLQPEGKLNAQGRMLAGDIALARGNLEQAAKIYRGVSVIIDDPELTPAALEKACATLKKNGNDTEAVKVLNELQTRYPEYQLTASKP